MTKIKIAIIGLILWGGMALMYEVGHRKGKTRGLEICIELLDQRIKEKNNAKTNHNPI